MLSLPVLQRIETLFLASGSDSHLNPNKTKWAIAWFRCDRENKARAVVEIYLEPRAMQTLLTPYRYH
jgi:hypothetical protein